MNEFSWIPGSVALAAGLIVGLWMAFRLRRPAPARDDAHGADDLELKVADLEARRDELYARLRGEKEEELDEHETRALEHAAARALRDLDQARAELGRSRPRKRQTASKRGKAEPAVQAVPAPAGAVHHPFLWFLMGAGIMGLVGFLVFWAQQDAKPDPMAAQNAPPAASGVPDEGHPEGLQGLSPEVRAQAEALQARLTANPGDLGARKELAVLLAQHQQFFAAYQHAEKILEVSPDDPDALYISGVVRMTMGSSEEAIQLIDRVLARFPEHVLAHLVRGTALLQLERRDEALASWQAGLQAAGGSNADIERMIAEEFGTAPVQGGAPPSPAPSSPAASSPPSAPADSGEPRVYKVSVEVASGTEIKPGASLFVSVHDLNGGPPAAVRRVGDPAFPLEVTLTQNDSMTGIALPARGRVVIRLDSDGHPGTESPEDLSAQGEASAGELAKFVLW